MTRAAEAGWREAGSESLLRVQGSSKTLEEYCTAVFLAGDAEEQLKKDVERLDPAFEMRDHWRAQICRRDANSHSHQTLACVPL